jgi:hypothetical protein
MARESETSGSHLVRQPVSALIWWCLPIVLAVLADNLRLPVRELAGVWCAAFVWMASGCILNAVRCHRLHCYISGPAFLGGAAACGLLAAGILATRPHMLSYITAGTILLALASFLPELIWRKYV